ncbi:hypothetical protein SLS60_009976 [Paraconiothyrium brasiliense]|uniref:AAA+ ATPase domain-containing protein n=1 Tax=Paraconiothyrium brasiliense TaxID=300254 RepID=A0ABR3QT06_9PLEO
MTHEAVSSAQNNTSTEPEDLPHKKTTRLHMCPEPKTQLQGSAAQNGHVESLGSSLTAVTSSTDTQQKKLMDRIRFLEKENTKLKHPEAQTNILLIYHIMGDGNDYEGDSTPYLDAPQWSVGGGQVLLKAAAPLADLQGYIQRMPGVAFVVSKYYNARQQTREIEQSQRDKTPLPSPVPIRETISLKSTRMLKAMTAYVKQMCGFMQQFPHFDPHEPIAFPYLFWFCDRRTRAFRNLGPVHKRFLFALTTWIESNYRDLYDRVEKELLEGIVSNESIPFLFRPGMTVVIKKEQNWVAGVSTSWASHRSTERKTVSEVLIDDSTSDDDDNPLVLLSQLYDDSAQKIAANRSAESSSKNTKQYEVWRVNYWTYAYDGSFYQVEQHVDVLIPTTDQKRVTELDAYPLTYASEDIGILLEQRGRTIWKCRHRKFISYEDKSNTYGVDRIRDVTWNKQSFARLVIDEMTKELIQALITNQIDREQSTDIVANKGNGLIILLHGVRALTIQSPSSLIRRLMKGPGTGKTLTAESVAEIAEKPLFRVTCGDIGTKPEEVEKYLESVFHLSKTWDAVVLLDEADVFLEQRTHSNLERNALVSVFLRVLEYHEGILVLTSNRVGTFDEAFKSRIQLALHYESLTQSQRHKIWKNFLNHLKDMESPNRERLPQDEGSVQNKDHASLGIDFEDIDCCLSELAKYEMNGRQIRNAITTARQLAKFKDVPMKASHIKHAIEVSSKFDKYLSDVHEGFSDDQIARGDGIR